MDKQSLQLLLAQGRSVERIAKRFGKDPSTISYWMERHRLEWPFASKQAGSGGLDRQQLEECVRAGMSIAEIAAEVGRSTGCVRHWLRVYGLRTVRARGERTRTFRAAKDAGLLEVTMSCPNHGETEYIIEGRGYYRCKRCRAESVVRHRQKIKTTLVEEAGGRCVICGYSRSVRALQFHHLDPECKRLGLSSQGVTYSLDALRAEAAKCALLCANCHVEVEEGLATLPLEFRKAQDYAQ